MTAAKLDLNRFEGYASGPWKVVYEAPSLQISVCRENFCIADCGVGEGALETADLIAAAPDLLAECKRQREQIETLREALTELLECPLPGRMQNGVDRTRTNFNHQNICHRARAALAATGDA